MSETEVLITVSDFSLLLGIISWKGALLLKGEGYIFKWGGAPWGASALMGGFPPIMGNSAECSHC